MGKKGRPHYNPHEDADRATEALAAFSVIDLTEGGAVGLDEWVVCLGSLNGRIWPASLASSLFQEADSNGDGLVDASEFTAWVETSFHGRAVKEAALFRMEAPVGAGQAAGSAMVAAKTLRAAGGLPSAVTFDADPQEQIKVEIILLSGTHLAKPCVAPSDDVQRLREAATLATPPGAGWFWKLLFQGTVLTDGMDVSSAGIVDGCGVSAVKVVHPDVERMIDLLSALAQELRSDDSDNGFEFHEPLTEGLDMVDALGWFGQRWFDFECEYDRWHNFAPRGIKYAGREILGPAVPNFVELLSDPHPKVRQLGAWCLAGVGHDAKAAMPQLAAALDDPDYDVQAEAFEALRVLGRFSPEHVLPILVRKLNNSSVSPISFSKSDWTVRIIDGLLEPHELRIDVPRFEEPIAGAANAVVPELWRIVRQPLTDADDRRAHDHLKRKARRSLKRLQPEAVKKSWLEELTKDWDAREDWLLSRLREAKQAGETLREAQYSALKEMSLTNTTAAPDTSLEELLELEKLTDAKTAPKGDMNELPFPIASDPMTLRDTLHADTTTLLFAIEGEAAWACLPCGIVGNSCQQEDVKGESDDVEDGSAAGASDGDVAAKKSQAAAVCSGGNTECDTASATGIAVEENTKQTTLQQRWQKGETRRRRHFLNGNNTTPQRAAFWCAFSTHYFERLSHLEGGDPFHQWTRSSQDPMPLQDLEGFFHLRAQRQAAAQAKKQAREVASGESTDGPRRGRPYPCCAVEEEE